MLMHIRICGLTRTYGVIEKKLMPKKIEQCFVEIGGPTLIIGLEGRMIDKWQAITHHAHYTHECCTM